MAYKLSTMLLTRNRSFNIVGQPFGSGNIPCCSSNAWIQQPITFCQTSYYEISFAIRQTSASAQYCGIEIGWLDSNYGVVQTPQLSSSWTLYGPTTFESVHGNGIADNPDGSFNAN